MSSGDIGLLEREVEVNDTCGISRAAPRRKIIHDLVLAYSLKKVVLLHKAKRWNAGAQPVQVTDVLAWKIRNGTTLTGLRQADVNEHQQVLGRQDPASLSMRWES
ncbi:hypothetical protein NX059_005688 [Plenodomus lindquistii]|nr:hypothetical protein NX059_005688 [Plenodomus lindquistii]